MEVPFKYWARAGMEVPFKYWANSGGIVVPFTIWASSGGREPREKEVPFSSWPSSGETEAGTGMASGREASIMSLASSAMAEKL